MTVEEMLEEIAVEAVDTRKINGKWIEEHQADAFSEFVLGATDKAHRTKHLHVLIAALRKCMEHRDGAMKLHLNSQLAAGLIDDSNQELLSILKGSGE